MTKLYAMLLRWGPPLLWMAAIFIASGTPGNEVPNFGSLDYFVKKGGHMLSYAFLGILLRRGLGGGNRNMMGAWLLAVTYALLDEFHQSLVPGRHPSYIDVFVFDGLGAAAGLLLSWRYFRPRQRHAAPES